MTLDSVFQGVSCHIGKEYFHGHLVQEACKTGLWISGSEFM